MIRICICILSLILGWYFLGKGFAIQEQNRSIMSRYRDMRYDNPAGYPGVTLSQKEAVRDSCGEDGGWMLLGTLCLIPFAVIVGNKIMEKKP